MYEHEMTLEQCEKCPIIVKEGEPDPTYPIEKRCDMADCPDFDHCWAPHGKTPLVGSIMKEVAAKTKHAVNKFTKCDCGRQLRGKEPTPTQKAKGVDMIFICGPCQIEMHVLSSERQKKIMEARDRKRRNNR